MDLAISGLTIAPVIAFIIGALVNIFLQLAYQLTPSKYRGKGRCGLRGDSCGSSPHCLEA